VDHYSSTTTTPTTILGPTTTTPELAPAERTIGPGR